jgi:hypothetical protein
MALGDNISVPEASGAGFGAVVASGAASDVVMVRESEEMKLCTPKKPKKNVLAFYGQ